MAKEALGEIMQDYREELGQHFDYLKKFALRFVGTPDEADDLVQETMKAALETNNFRGESSLRTWLGGILRFKALSYLRKRSWERERFLDGSEYDDALETLSVNADQLDSMISEETLSGILLKIGALPLPQREAIMETKVFGLPVIEVASRIGIPEGTVKTRVHYGIKKLRQEENSPVSA